jgi:DNA invertase Pin-like site-specific DNA recombinase
MTSAILYAAKSSADDRGSIATQLADGRALAEGEGYNIVAEYQDEAKSAYRGNRGDGLADAKAHAERLGGVLVVQHSDRLARGDGLIADHLGELIFWARRAGVTLRSVQDRGTFENLMLGVMMGERNHEDSSRKALSVRDGLERRRKRGQPMGAVATGYRVVPELDEREQPRVDSKGKVVTRRVPDPGGVALVERVLRMLGSGSTPGDVARALNAEGVPTLGGSADWNRRTVRKLAQNTAYIGEKGYPRIVSDEVFQKAQDQLRRTDPVGAQVRKGGRKGDLVDDAYILRSVIFCAGCGSPMYTTKAYKRLGRAYVCRAKREARGTCDAPPIGAEAVEVAALAHLRDFRLDVDAWVGERVAEATSQRDVLERRAAELRREVGRVEKNLARVRRLMDDAEDDGIATAALREIGRYESQRAEALARVSDAEARVAEFTPEPDAEAAQRYWDGIRDLIAGRVERVEGAVEINAAIRDLLAGAWAVDTGQGLRVQFVLRGDQDWPENEPLPSYAPPTFVDVKRAEDVEVPDLGDLEPEPYPVRTLQTVHQT